MSEPLPSRSLVEDVLDALEKDHRDVSPRDAQDIRWKAADMIRKLSASSETTCSVYDRRGEVPILVDRNDVIEDCAKVAERHFIYGHSIAGPHFAKAGADAIRALKGRSDVASTASSDLDKLAAIVAKEGADFDVCPPGHHGGSGDDANRWLLTIMPPDHRNSREFFADTLAEVVRQASLSSWERKR